MTASRTRYSAWHRNRAVLIGVLLFGIAAGALFRGLFDPADTRTLANYLRSSVNGAVVGLAIIGAHLLLGRAAGSWLHRRSLAGELLIDGAAMAIAGTLAQVFMQIVLFGETLAGVHAFVPGQITFALVLSFVFLAAVHIIRLIGTRQFFSALLGRYRRPLEEWRVIMFLDIVGATAMAERLGPTGVASLLSRFFHDIDDDIVDHGGDIHAYVGDAVIASWPCTPESAGPASIDSVMAMRRRLAHLEDAYRQDFGVAPKFRAVLHCGPVVVSEIGRSKQQICYLGDTMNVAARLEQHAKQTGHAFIVSKDLADRLQARSDISLNNVGTVHLRGRSTPTGLFEPVPTAADHPSPR